jgi:hypothetical protein
MITTFTAELPFGIAKAIAEQPHKMYLYLEYTNTVGNIPTGYTQATLIPNFANPRDYYKELSGKNYIRVQAIRDPNIVSTVAGSTYTTSTNFFGQSSSTSQGELAGENFGTNSICYGAALVLALDDAEPSSDVIMARAYFTGVGERLTKTASSELFVTFPLTVSVTAP